jgi:DNA-directed RNA polymerase specialized sigma24 family protein
VCRGISPSQWAKQDWLAIGRQIMGFAVYISRSSQAAEDLTQEALSRAIDPERDLWDPDVEPRVAKHLMRIIENIHRGDRDKREVRRDPRNAGAVIEAMRPYVSTPEGAAIEAETRAEAQACIEDIKRHVAGEPLDVQLVELSERGIDKPGKQAALANRPVEEIRKARKRIDRAVLAVLRKRREDTAELEKRSLLS